MINKKWIFISIGISVLNWFFIYEYTKALLKLFNHAFHPTYTPKYVKTRVILSICLMWDIDMFPSYVPVYDPQISLGECRVRNVHVSR